MTAPKPRKFKRDQHEGFGKEFRQFGASKIKADKEAAGIVSSELNHLRDQRAKGLRHTKEDVLSGPLSEVGYLRLYFQNRSIRAYFTVVNGTLWMLAFDPNKRQDDLSPGMKKRLLDRLNDVKKRT